jgi:60S ribosomal subunit assembly/export protein LOC1
MRRHYCSIVLPFVRAGCLVWYVCSWAQAVRSIWCWSCVCACESWLGFVGRSRLPAKLTSATANADRNFSAKKVRVVLHLYFARTRATRHPPPTAMAPIKSIKGTSSKGGKSGGSRSGGPAKKSAKSGAAPEGISKKRQKTLALAKPGGAQKSKSKKPSGKPKRRVYKESELDLPKLNGIIPAGIAKPKGQKKGKTFVDDSASMMAIMSIVNAEKDKDVESKIMRARQLEEVREAKRKEMETRAEEKASKFEETKKGLKKKRKNRTSEPVKLDVVDDDVDDEPPRKSKGKKKRVSFG